MAKIQPEVQACIDDFRPDGTNRTVHLRTSLKEQLEALSTLNKEILELLKANEDIGEDKITSEMEESCSLRAAIKTKILAINALLVPNPAPASPQLAQQPLETAS